MRKEKRKKEAIEFNPADYNYMDDMTFDGWVWEFIRRNKTYTAKFKLFMAEFDSLVHKIQTLSLSGSEVTKLISNNIRRVTDKKSEVDSLVHKIQTQLCRHTENLSYFRNFLKKRIRDLKKQTHYENKLYSSFCRIPKALIPKMEHFVVNEIIYESFVRCFGKEFSEEFEIGFPYYDAKMPGIPELSLDENRKEGFKFYIKGVTPVKEKIGEDKDLQYNSLERDLLCTEKKEDTLFLGINLSAPKIDVEKNIKNILDSHFKKRQEKRRHVAKWKYYLIVYDLKEKYPEISYEDIADLLSKKFPSIETTKVKNRKKIKIMVDSEGYFTAKTCNNFYKSASSLINGEYKKYLYE